MNTITPISNVSFSGGSKTPIKIIERTPCINRTFQERLYPQTKKMQDIMSQIMKFFEEQSKKARIAVKELNEKYPYFSVSFFDSPCYGTKNFGINKVPATLFEKNGKKLNEVKRIYPYELEIRKDWGVDNVTFNCHVTTPESGLNLYSVADQFMKTTKNGKPAKQTIEGVEKALQTALDNLKASA